MTNYISFSFSLLPVIFPPLMSSPPRPASKCEPITIPLCEDVPYNFTRMPNLMGHQDQAAAAIEVHEFKPLVEMGCSKYLQFFLCSIYAPMCADQVDIPIPACQTLCLEVKSRCAPVLKSLNFPWPEALECDKLPMPENGLCMEHPDIEDTNDHNAESEQVKNTLPALHLPEMDHQRQGELEDQKIMEEAAALCPNNFAYNGDFFSHDRCGPMCNSPAWYSTDQLDTAEACVAVGSALSVVSGLLSLLITARQGGTRTGLVMIITCQLLVMVGMVIRAAVGREASSCEKTQLGLLVVVTEGQYNSVCNTVALLDYVGWQAGLGWWLTGVFFWWRNLAGATMETTGTIHGFIWGVSIVGGLLVYTTVGVQANPLTGLCSMHEDLVSSLLPSGAILTIGLAILIMGWFLARSSGHKTREDNTGLLCLLYFLPALGVFIWHTWVYVTTDSPSHPHYHLPPPPPPIQVIYTRLVMKILTSLVTPAWVLVFQLHKYLKHSPVSESSLLRTATQNIYQEHPVRSTNNTVSTNCSSIS